MTTKSCMIMSRRPKLFVIAAHLPTLIVFIFVSFAHQRFVDYHSRLMFNVESIGQRKEAKALNDKECANWLLKNIIPPFVMEPLFKNQGYAKNYEIVGVAFITITNYLSDLYEEQFEGGQFYGRVLNELYADIDSIVISEKYRSHIEKIKTIGPTYMVASGLGNEESSAEKHLLALVEFVREFMLIANAFSENMFNFKFVIRAGLNFGSVTAGVLGNCRLSFDIWGDTVNVASRMDSKGVEGRLQVTADVANYLTEKCGLLFEYRGAIDIKGKDVMDVYLLK